MQSGSHLGGEGSVSVQCVRGPLLDHACRLATGPGHLGGFRSFVSMGVVCAGHNFRATDTGGMTNDQE